MKKYAKMAAQVAATVLAALVPILSLGAGVTADQWINVAIIGAGAAAVFTAPNVPGATYTKEALAVLTAGLTVLSSVIAGGITSAEWIQIILATAGALGVTGARNTAPKTGDDLSRTGSLNGAALAAAGGRHAADGKDTP